MDEWNAPDQLAILRKKLGDWLERKPSIHPLLWNFSDEDYIRYQIEEAETFIFMAGEDLRGNHYRSEIVVSKDGVETIILHSLENNNT